MGVGTNWTTLNVGAMLRQRRDSEWGGPNAVSGFKFALGLCSGTVSPYGVTTPAHFVGLISNTAWARYGIYNLWDTGWKISTVAGATQTNHDSSSSGLTLRASEREDLYSTAVYLRFTKSGSNVTVTLFAPTGPNYPTKDDFRSQVRRDKFSTSIPNHDTYQESEATFALDQAGKGFLDSVNIMSSVPNYAVSALSGVEFLAISAVKL